MSKKSKAKKAVVPKIEKLVKAKTRKTTVKTPAPKKETKISKVVSLLSRDNGASMQDLIDATQWQKHTIRATISRVISKDMGLKVETSMGDDKTRLYKILSGSQ